MIVNIFKLNLTTVFCFLVFNICCNTGNIYASQSNEVLNIVITGEENGFLEPCGCSEEQLGGLKRRFEFLSKFRQNEQFVLPISTGDVPRIPNRQNEIKTEIIFNAFLSMDYAVHNIGEKDLDMGSDLLHYLSLITDVPNISCNIKFVENPGIQVDPYIIKTIKTKKAELNVGILGMLDPDFVENDLFNIEILDPVEALKPLVSKLRKDVDLLILVSHSDEDIAIEMANHFPELDLIITGHNNDEPATSGKVVNNTLIVSAARYGKYVGIVKYSVDNNKLSLKRNSDGLPMELVPLGEKYNKPSEFDTVLEEYKNKVKDEDLLAQHQKIPLNTNESYLGSMECGACHMEIYMQWNKTKHAHAYETLEKVRSQFDPECVKCHTVGFNYSTGFKSIEKSEHLIGVGCESCHSFGSLHVQQTDVPYGKVDKYNCIACHDPENSPHFKFEPYWEKVKHPVK